MIRLGDPKRESGTFARYLCIGAVCFVSNWALMLLIDKDRYVVSSAVCFVLVGSFAYVCHAVWTFRAPLEWRGWITYLLGLTPSYPISLALLSVLHDVLRIPLFWALPLATLIMLAVNFLVARCTIVRARPSGRSRLETPADV